MGKKTTSKDQTIIKSYRARSPSLSQSVSYSADSTLPVALLDEQSIDYDLILSHVSDLSSTKRTNLKCDISDCSKTKKADQYLSPNRGMHMHPIMPSASSQNGSLSIPNPTPPI